MKKLLVITDMSFRGSGYFYLMSPILEKMSQEYDIKVIGLAYRGEEHNFGFSIVGANTYKDATAYADTIIKLWQPNAIICGLDIPLQIALHQSLNSFNLPYVAVTPLENPPLTMSWAAELMSMSHVFFISEVGDKAAKTVGLKNTSHIPVGVESSVYHPATDGEKSAIRKGLGYTDDDLVIITVADNQERKNLWAAMASISMLVHPDIKLAEIDNILLGQSNRRVSDYARNEKVKYILVTREESQIGHNLRDLAMSLDIMQNISIIERGIPQEQLRNLYVASDVFLLTSKAEGLGIPVLEAMSCHIPCVTTNTGALNEIISGSHGGILVKSEYGFIDVWGNSWRDMVSIEDVVHGIHKVFNTEFNWSYVDGWLFERTAEKCASLISSKLKEVLG